MGMVSSSATSRVMTLFRSLLFATATPVALMSILLLAFSFFDTSARWFDFAGGVLFVMGGCALLATVASALVRGPTTRIKNSNAGIRLIFRYLRYDAGWFRIVFGFLFAIAVVALILFETSGVANGNVASDHGRYILTNDSGSSFNNPCRVQSHVYSTRSLVSDERRSALCERGNYSDPC